MRFYPSELDTEYKMQKNPETLLTLDPRQPDRQTAGGGGGPARETMGRTGGLQEKSVMQISVFMVWRKES